MTASQIRQQTASCQAADQACVTLTELFTSYGKQAASLQAASHATKHPAGLPPIGLPSRLLPLAPSKVWECIVFRCARSIGELTGVIRLVPVLLLRLLRDVMRTVPPQDSALGRLTGGWWLLGR